MLPVGGFSIFFPTRSNQFWGGQGALGNRWSWHQHRSWEGGASNIDRVYSLIPTETVSGLPKAKDLFLLWLNGWRSMFLSSCSTCKTDLQCSPATWGWMILAVLKHSHCPATDKRFTMFSPFKGNQATSSCRFFWGDLHLQVIDDCCDEDVFILLRSGDHGSKYAPCKHRLFLAFVCWWHSSFFHENVVSPCHAVQVKHHNLQKVIRHFRIWPFSTGEISCV